MLMIISLTTVVLIAVAVRLLYNVYFHPLSSCKGPAYLAVSDIPLALLQLWGTSHLAIERAHRKYGNVVRIAPNTLSYIQPSAWKDIYGSRKGRPTIANVPKDPHFYNEMWLDKKTVSMASDEDAAVIRRAINPAFSQRALLEFEPMLRDHVDRLIAQLTKTSSQQASVDVCKWFTFSMFDIAGDFAFGEDLGCVRQGAYHEWVELVVEFFYAGTVMYQCHKFWPLNRILAALIPSSVISKKQRHDEASLLRVRRRMNTSTDSERSDFMYHFLRHAEKEQLSTPVIEAQSAIIIAAGSETTAVTLISSLYYALTSIDVHRKLRSEVLNAFATTAEITLQNVHSKLPYLAAVVKEALRMRPPIANGLTREVKDPNGALICGNWVAPTTVVVINHYCANRSAQNFRNPECFVPERWLNDPAYAGDEKDALQPFSFGPRDCPGKRFALNNIYLTLAHLFWNFDMKLEQGTEDWDLGQKVFTGWHQPPLPVVMKPRG